MRVTSYNYQTNWVISGKIEVFNESSRQSHQKVPGAGKKTDAEVKQDKKVLECHCLGEEEMKKISVTIAHPQRQPICINKCLLFLL